MNNQHSNQQQNSVSLPAVRIGTDLVAVQRIEKAIARESFLKKVFHPREIEQCSTKTHPSASYAARFAAKEAFFKALGTGLYTQGMGPQDVWIENAENGRPKLCISPEASALLRTLGSNVVTDVSLAHDAQMAIATVIFQIIP
ncbi:MAG: holo-[acyl-carrier-protein] synthase [Betaproteobacteria bacterium]|nr:holo-[acyl-carrier-protein] synthase [Betaproteobacteria bacterium]